VVNVNAESHRNDGTDCPTRGQLEAYALGKLSKDQIESLSSHLSTCAKCQAAMESLEGLCDDLTAALLQPVAPELGIESREVDELVGRVELLGKASDRDAARPQQPPFVLKQLGDYQIFERIGRGGMSVVYKAQQTGSEQAVALKVLAPDRMHNPRALARFRREVTALEELDHPNIVHAYRAGEANGWHFLAMELLDGANLSRLVRWGGPIPVAEACEIIRQAAIGLQHAHENGLVHRDVKPSNLMLTADRTIKLLDLGLARLCTEAVEDDGPVGPEQSSPGSANDSVVTGTGHLLGSFGYMAPEQRWNARDADARADIYSLGCTLFFLLTGKPPMRNRWYERFLVYNGPLQIPLLSRLIGRRRRDIRKKLVAVLDKMTASSPDERFSTAAEVAEAMSSMTRGNDLAGLLARRRSFGRSEVQRACEALGIDGYAPPPEIQKAYRQLAVRFHPDMNRDDPDAEERFREIQQAYELLCEPKRQRRKGAFHNVRSAFLTVRVRSRTRMPERLLSDGGIGRPLITMATIFYLFIMFMLFLPVILSPVSTSLAPIIFNTDADLDSMMAEDDSSVSENSVGVSQVVWGFAVPVTALYLCFVIAVLTHK